MFIVFQQFRDKKDAEELASRLNAHNIQTEIGDDSSGVDPIFTGGGQVFFEVRIKTEDVERANDIMRSETTLETIDPDHYLHTFDNDELYEVLLKQDEWSNFDVSASRQILEQRGKVVDDDLMRSLWNQRLRDLSQPSKDQNGWVFFGYVMALMGGLVGIVIGYVLWTSKKTLPDGSRFPYYSERDRRNGKTIFTIGCITFPLFFIIRVGLLNS